MHAIRRPLIATQQRETKAEKFSKLSRQQKTLTKQWETLRDGSIQTCADDVLGFRRTLLAHTLQTEHKAYEAPQRLWSKRREERQHLAEAADNLRREVETTRTPNWDPPILTDAEVVAAINASGLFDACAINGGPYVYDCDTVVCVAVRPGPRAGYLLTYQLRNPASPEKNPWSCQEHYPAIQGNPMFAVETLCSQFPALMDRLGVSYGDHAFTIPCPQSLMHDLNLLRAKAYDVPDIQICPDGAATHGDFILANTEKEHRTLVMAKHGREVLHDFGLHFLPMLGAPKISVDAWKNAWRLGQDFVQWARTNNVQAVAGLELALALMIDSDTNTPRDLLVLRTASSLSASRMYGPGGRLYSLLANDLAVFASDLKPLGITQETWGDFVAGWSLAWDEFWHHKDNADARERFESQAAILAEKLGVSSKTPFSGPVANVIKAHLLRRQKELEVMSQGLDSV